jgi:chromosome segregation ATPase
VLASLLLLISVFLVDADAQTRSKKRTRRTTQPVVTNPSIAPPTDGQSASSEAKIVSTADENSGDTEQTTDAPAPKTTSKKKPQAEQAQMEDTINALSDQVERLNDKLSKMQDNDKTLLDMERLTRAEQRAENLRSQQVDVEAKLADLQARLEQIDYSLRPENIERAAGYGTVHPEEAREARRRQLEGEKGRVQAQIRILETSRQRLETALLTADAEVDRLRRRLEMQEQQESLSPPESDSKPTRSRKPE